MPLRLPSGWDTGFQVAVSIGQAGSEGWVRLISCLTAPLPSGSCEGRGRNYASTSDGSGGWAEFRVKGHGHPQLKVARPPSPHPVSSPLTGAKTAGRRHYRRGRCAVHLQEDRHISRALARKRNISVHGHDFLVHCGLAVPSPLSDEGGRTSS